MKPERFVSVPVEIEAVHWDGTPKEATELIGWVTAYGGRIGWTNEAFPVLRVSTLEGEMLVRPGSWVIRGTEGEFYPIAHTVFQERYRSVEPGNSGVRRRPKRSGREG